MNHLVQRSNHHVATFVSLTAYKPILLPSSNSSSLIDLLHPPTLNIRTHTYSSSSSNSYSLTTKPARSRPVVPSRRAARPPPRPDNSIITATPTSPGPQNKTTLPTNQLAKIHHPARLNPTSSLGSGGAPPPPPPSHHERINTQFSVCTCFPDPNG